MYLLRICFARGKHVRSKCEAHMKQIQLCCSDVVRLCLPRGAVLWFPVAALMRNVFIHSLATHSP